MKKLKLVVPKGRIFEKVSRLLQDIGIKINGNNRLYIPQSNDSELEIKIMKPQNIAQLIELGSHDIGFTGFDGGTLAGLCDLEIRSPIMDMCKTEAVHSIFMHLMVDLLRDRLCGKT